MSSFEPYPHDEQNESQTYTDSSIETSDIETSGVATSAPSPASQYAPQEVGGTAARLRSFVERIERLEEEKKNLMEDIKAITSEAKGEGFDVKTLKQVIKIRAMDSGKRMEQEALLDTYLSALGLK